MIGVLTHFPPNDAKCCICNQPITDGYGATVLLTPMWPTPEEMPNYEIPAGDFCVEFEWHDEVIIHLACIGKVIPALAHWEKILKRNSP